MSAEERGGEAFKAALSKARISSGETFDVVVNYPPGGEPVPVHISINDPAGVLSFSEVSPGGVGAQRAVVDGRLTVSFRASANRPVWGSKPKAYPFTVEVESQSGAVQTLSGEIVAKTLLPVWALPVLGVMVCCLAGGSLWLAWGWIFPPDTGSQIAVISPTTQGQEQVTSAPTQPPIALTQAPPTTEAAIASTQTVATHTPPATARRIAFASNRNGNWDIYLMEEDGGNLIRLTDNPADDSFPVWSPDGRQILFHSNRNGNFDIFVINPDGSGLRQLTSDARADTFASWSPDGRQIVFQSRRDGPRQLYVMNADGSGQRRLTHSATEDYFPSWSPDGRQILYSTLIDGVLRLATIQPDGSGQRQLEHVGEVTWSEYSYSFPVWSPDGTQIAAVLALDSNLEVISVFRYTPGNVEWIFWEGKDEGSKHTHPRWSSDGEYIFFSTNGAGNFDLFRMRADGSDPGVLLTTDPSDEESPSLFP